MVMASNGLEAEKPPKRNLVPRRKKGLRTLIPLSSPRCEGDKGERAGRGNLPWPTLDTPYYMSHSGLQLKALFWYPVEVLANYAVIDFGTGSGRWGGKQLIQASFPKEEGLSLHQLYALAAEDLVRLTSKLAGEIDSLPDSLQKSVRKYRRNLRILHFQRATWDACLTAYQVVRTETLRRENFFRGLTAGQRRSVTRWRTRLIVDPLIAAKELKAQAARARSWYFDGKKPNRTSMACFDYKWQALEFSYCARATPPPPDSGEGLQGLLQRLTSKPPAVDPEWRPWIKDYIRRFARGKGELYTAPSGNACVGFPRMLGGHAAGVRHLCKIGAAVMIQRGDDSEFLRWSHGAVIDGQDVSAQGDEEKVFKVPVEQAFNFLPNVSLNLQRQLIEGTFYVLDNVEFLPVLPISAPEKGLKTRFPTCALTAANLVLQVLRRVADHVLVNDPRISQSMGGSRDVCLENAGGPWYSQDATAATDLHPQWLTQTFYEELALYDERLRPYTKYFNLLFGPKRILLPLDGAVLPPSSLFPSYMAGQPDTPYLSVSEKGDWRTDSVAFATRFLNSTRGWLYNPTEHDLDNFALSSTGQMMGDPTSFPVLPLLSIYCGELTLKRLPYGRRELRALRNTGVRVKRGEVAMKTCGDDAVLPRWTEARRTLYDNFMRERGVLLQLEKSYYHSRKALFKEIPYVDGFPQEHTFVSTLSAPPGGSKGSVTWATQPTAMRGDPDEFVRPPRASLWKCSPFFHFWKALYALGAPLGASEMYGGISLPIFPKASTRCHYEWLTFMASRPLEDLLVGTGLAPSSGNAKSAIDRLSRLWLREIRQSQEEIVSYNLRIPTETSVKRVFRWKVPPSRRPKGVKPEDLDTPADFGRWEELTSAPPAPLPLILVTSPDDEDGTLRQSLKVAARNALGKLRSAEFYYRTPHDPKTPSGRLYLRKFMRKVMVHPGIPGSYENLSADIARKLAVFLRRRGTTPYAQFDAEQTSFGLERSGPIRRRMIAPTKFVEA
jgi:hypothetical protein